MAQENSDVFAIDDHQYPSSGEGRAQQGSPIFMTRFTKNHPYWHIFYSRNTILKY